MAERHFRTESVLGICLRAIELDHVVDVFLDFAAVYPAGSYVLTNENEIGIVCNPYIVNFFHRDFHFQTYQYC